MSTDRDGGFVIPPWTMGDRLRKARETRGLGQREFAAEIGVSQKTVTNAENDRAVRGITIKQWAVATGFPEEWLTDGVDPSMGNPRPDDDPDGGSVLPHVDSNHEPAAYLFPLVSAA